MPGLPSPDLNPNSATKKAHWSRLASAVTSARGEAQTEARQQLGWERPAHLEGAVISLSITFYYPANTPPQETPDLDNLMASTKPYIDGIFDYLGDNGAIKINDRQIEHISISRVPASGRWTDYKFFDRRTLDEPGKDAF